MKRLIVICIIVLLVCAAAGVVLLLHNARQAHIEQQAILSAPITLSTKLIADFAKLCEPNGGLVQIDLPRDPEKQLPLEAIGVCANGLKSYKTIPTVK